jgi:hypothetical protein
MSPEIKHLSLGLAIGAVIMIFLGMGLVLVNPGIAMAAIGALGPNGTLAAMPTSSTWPASPTGTSTVAFTATFTPIPTMLPRETITATSTPDPIEAMLDSGNLIFAGPLSNDQQILLYESSLYYVKPTIEDSLRLARQINGVSYGNPSNTCGPLAIAIMQDAGLVSNDITPHDFWLLNPFLADDRKKLERAFPPDQFDHLINLTPINQIDWRAFSLEPGDFLYIKHGSWGNFDHMLVVNRVDNGLRAYAVTNYNTQDGFIINEALLYDPADRSAGLFHEWTKQEFAALGSTGFGGFELWRIRKP